MENLVTAQHFWRDKRVLITGHTGFKGSWLTLWLQSLGATITGYALPPTSNPSLFMLADVKQGISHIEADIRDFPRLKSAMQSAQPDIILHLAAQALVRHSYQEPIETYSTNVLGTVHVLEAARACPSVKAIVNVTTDKCYENKEWYWGYRENDRLGGHDPYSNSKACAELVTSAYRSSFFEPESRIALASARAGNVIGGGDWSKDRLIPDVIHAFLHNQPITLRYPQATRPWQHVLEPLHGYILLAEKLYHHGNEFAEAWNFGPDDQDIRPVVSVVKQMREFLDNKLEIITEQNSQPHEARLLKLDCAKAKTKLRWHPKWNLDKGLLETANWYKAFQNQQNMRNFTLKQINDFLHSEEQNYLMEAVTR